MAALLSLPFYPTAAGNGREKTGAAAQLNGNLGGKQQTFKRLYIRKYFPESVDGRRIELGEAPCCREDIYAITKLAAGGNDAMDNGTAYISWDGKICYIPDTTQKEMTIEISVLYL